MPITDSYLRIIRYAAVVLYSQMSGYVQITNTVVIISYASSITLAILQLKKPSKSKYMDGIHYNNTF